MACKTSYRDYITCGVDEFVLDTDLTPTTIYDTVITAPSGAKYHNTLTVDAFGNLTFPVADYPLGLFNPYAGPFLIHLDTGCEDHLFCDAYKFIEFEVVNGTGEKNTLTCCAPSPTPDPANTCCVTTTQTFTNEAVTVVPYTGTRPTIEVAYLNGDGTYTIAGISTTVTFDANEFTIDHGGVASGIIKMLK